MSSIVLLKVAVYHIFCKNNGTQNFSHYQTQPADMTRKNRTKSHLKVLFIWNIKLYGVSLRYKSKIL